MPSKYSVSYLFKKTRDSTLLKKNIIYIEIRILKKRYMEIFNAKKIF